MTYEIHYIDQRLDYPGEAEEFGDLLRIPDPCYCDACEGSVGNELAVLITGPGRPIRLCEDCVALVKDGDSLHERIAQAAAHLRAMASRMEAFLTKLDPTTTVTIHRPRGELPPANERPFS